MREGRGCVERREGVFKNCGGGKTRGSDSGEVAGREKMEGATDMVIRGRDHETDEEAW